MNLRKFLLLGIAAASGAAGFLAPVPARADQISLSNDPDIEFSSGSGNFLAAGTGSYQETSVAGPLNQPQPLAESLSSMNGPPGSATLTTSANFGALSASTSGSTNPIPGNATEIRAGNDVASAPIVAYQDSLTISSNSLAVGTPVTLLFTESLNATTASSGYASDYDYGFAQVDGYYHITDNNLDSSVAVGDSFSGTTLNGNGLLYPYGDSTTPDVDDIETVSFQAEVGDTVDFLSSIYAVGFSDSNDGYHDNSFSYSANSNTCIDMQTAGATFATQSGTQYCSAFSATTAVPEPSSLSLFGAGLLSFGGFVAYRRRNQFAR